MNNNSNCYAAIDLGASSGRIVVGYIEAGKLILKEIFRFDNIQIRINGHDCWDLDMIENNILKGLSFCKKSGYIPKTIGIDTWGVDFVGIDKSGKVVGNPVAYRDKRTEGIMDESYPMTFEQIYRRCGIQKLEFNTLYQMVALKRQNQDIYNRTYKFLMIPEYLMYKLTGKLVSEYTNCSTTSMINVESCDWDKEIFTKYAFDKDKFISPSMPGFIIGPVTEEVSKKIGFKPNVVLCATHDTGSAYLSVPSNDKNSAILSSGTWSLLGCINDHAITVEAARNANFTNEGGYQKKFRFLKNIMGLWIIQSVRRELNGVDYVEGKEKSNCSISLKDIFKDYEDKQYSFLDLANAARKSSYFTCCFDVNDSRFLSPNSMIQEVLSACNDINQQVPTTIGELMNSIYFSLVSCYKTEIEQLSNITGISFDSLSIVGGGCQDDYLNQLTSDILNIDVYAGPIEGTSIGNIGVQLISNDAVDNLNDFKNIIRKSFEINKYSPKSCD